MYYREHQVEQLEHLPLREKAYRDWDYYYGDWSAENKHINKVNPASLLGKSLKYITRRYLHRMPKHRRSITTLLDTLRIFPYNEIGAYSWRYSWLPRRGGYHYLDKDNIVRYAPKVYQPWRVRNNMPHNQRMREYYERRAKTRKERRDKLKSKRIESSDLIDWVFYERKRKERALEKQKLIQHGFDPITSFRNH